MQPELINNRYQVVEKISQTFDVEVYKGFDLKHQSKIAIKLLNTEKISAKEKAEEEKRFTNEIQILTKLDHPNIVKLIDHGAFKESFFMVMPFLSGGTLADRLTQPIPYNEAALLLQPIADALFYCHEHGIVHRDLKPSNIIFLDSGKPILIDFFLAKNLNDGIFEEENLVGTPLYMSPEQISGGVTQQSDIYSLGLIFYEMITGNSPYKPYKGTNILMMKLTEELSLNADQFPPTVPEVVKTTIQKATRTKLTERYQSMEELKEALVKISKTKATSTKRTLISAQNSEEEAVANDNSSKNPLGRPMGFFKASQNMLNFVKTVTDIVDDLLLTKAGTIEKVAASQIKILTKYYALALEQADRSFKAAMFWAGIGLVAFIGALLFLLTNQARDMAVISTISGALVEVISGINFYLYNRSSAQLGEFRGQLQETQKILLANSICEKMSGERKQQTRSLIALKAAGIGMDFDDSFIKKKAASYQSAQIIGIESGSLASENVQIHNQSKHPLNLAHWTLSDTANHKYQFPEITLKSNKSIKVWTKKGQDNSSNLFWGRKSPVWNNSGDCACLRDNMGKLIHQFSYGQKY